MSEVTRRSFLQLSVVSLAATACGSEDDADATTVDPAADGGAGAGPGALVDGGSGAVGDAAVSTPPPVPAVKLDDVAVVAKDFPYGVMAGDATDTRAMLWTKYTGQSALSVQVEVEGATDGLALVSRPVAASELGDAGFVHVDVDGLTAGARYRYAFFATEGGSPTSRAAFGSVRAALAPGAMEVVTFGGTSCTHQMGAPYPVLADAAKRKVDFFVHGGDHVYCDFEENAVSLAEYRAKYAEAWGTTGMSALHGSTGMITTWDDHEILNNWNPETIAPARIEMARKAYFEHRAERRDVAAPDRLWRTLTWGNTLALFVLDVRSERKPSTAAGANAQFISPEQMAWLKDGLAKSTAVFKFVVTSVPITNFPVAASGEADKWEGYPAQRESILDFVAEKALKGVWWLSGDLHFGSIGGVGATGARRQMHEVLMGPGGTNARNVTLSATQFDKVIEEKNYTLFRADPIKRELTVEFIGAGGSLFKRTYPA